MTTPLHVLDRGSGASAFLLLHGFGGSGRLWTEVMDRLAPTHRCVAPDLRGFGRSPGTSATVKDHVDDLEALVATCGLTDYVLAGHSMGGKIAAALTARQPRGLRALVLVAASPLSPEPMEEDARQMLLDGYGVPAAIEALVMQITAVPLPPADEAAFVADNLATSPAAWRWWLERGSREDLSARARKIRAPVYVLAGSRDPTLGVAVQNQTVRALGAARFTLAPDAGHLLPLEAPETCARLLLAAAGAAPRAIASGGGAPAPAAAPTLAEAC